MKIISETLIIKSLAGCERRRGKVFAKDLYLIMNKYNIPLQVPKKVSYFKFKRTTNNIFEILWIKVKCFFSLNSIEDDK